MFQYAIFNGKLVQKSQARVSIMDKGYFFDFAVYTSIKVIQGKAFFLKDHLNRLMESAQLIQLEHQFKKKDILKWIDQLIKENHLENSLLKIVLIGDPDYKTQAKLYIYSLGLTFYNKKLYQKGCSLISYFGERRVPQAKVKDMFLSFLAFRKAAQNNCLDALLIDRQACIREGTRSNFFVIAKNSIITPPKDKVLQGVTKKLVLKVAKPYFKIKHADISLSAVKAGQFDEIFITSTSMNVMPVKKVDNVVFKTDFAQTKKIQKLFKDYYKKEVLAR